MTVATIIKTGLCDAPPSTNKLWRFVPGKSPQKSAEYRAWIVAAGWQLKWCETPVTGCQVHVRVGKVNIQRDLDNMLKAILDLLVSLNWIEGDSVKHVTRVSIAYDPDGAPAGRCVVEVWQDEEIAS
jgi:Holliday junction resolvase RusA-like endonuclease